MSPIQQMLLGVGAVATKTYVDDVFSTNVYAGNSASTGSGTTQAINTGFDLASEGGLVWQKGRSFTDNHFLIDTVRGNTKVLRSNTSGAETTTSLLSAFTSTGYTAGDNIYFNGTGKTFASWTFLKSPAFTISEWTGDGASARTISHQLGSIPGLIIIKCTSHSGPDWVVWHRDFGATDFLKLNETSAKATDNEKFGGSSSVLPTSTTFTIGDSNDVNGSSRSYICYLFAGGESTAATARSVEFDGNDHLSLGTYSDLGAGTDDFTFEAWIKPDAWPSSGAIYSRIYGSDNQGLNIGQTNSNFVVQASAYNYISTTTFPEIGQWTHVAVTKQYVSSSNKSYIKLFFNGNLIKTYEDNGTVNWPTANNTGIGCEPGGDSQYFFDGTISNVRIVKGTAVYTSSFRPPTEPLTNITNTKLLCCNNSSTTGSTVTPGTITANGDPTASTDSPFDDPAGFVFGDAGDQNVIKCGSYQGATAAVSVNLGWEPSWVMVKRSNSTGGWRMYDNMRGLTDSGDPFFYANGNNTETTPSDDRIKVTSTGFETCPLSVGDSEINNGSSSEFIFLAIRRSDGYVGKPPELGTGVFGLGTRSGSSSNALSNVNVFTDFSIIKRYNNGGEYWATNARLTGKYSLQTNSTDAQLTGALPTSGGVWDHMAGHLVAANNGATNTGSDIIDYGWKRHAGFDVVAYKGNGSSSNREIAHSLNKLPQMMIIKSRSNAQPWAVYHSSQGAGKYFDGIGTGGISTGNTRFGGVEPTSTHFTLGTSGDVNYDTYTYIAMLFASTDVSKVGSYTGNATDTDPSSGTNTITFGFAPRFVIIKSTEANTGWVVLDTVRGWTDSDSRSIRLDRNNAQDGSDSGYGYATSTGMVLTGGPSHTNYNNYEYIYYAHA